MLLSLSSQALCVLSAIQVGQLPPPTLTTTSPAIVGQSLDYLLQGTTPLPEVVELLLVDLELAPTPLPLAPYGTLFLAASPALSVLPGDGSSTWSFPVPDTPSLAGTSLHAQALGLVYQTFVGEVLLSNLVSSEIQAEPPGAARLAVVPNLIDGVLGFMAVDTEGATSRHIGAAAPGGRVRAVDASLDGTRLVAVDDLGRRLVSYSVDATAGAWEIVGESPTDAGPLDVAVDPTGAFVYTANAGAQTIGQYAFDGAGVPQPLATPSVAVGAAPTSLSVDPDSRFLFATAPGTDLLAAFSIDPLTGRLTLTTALPVDGPSRIALGDEARWVHVLSPGLSAVTTWEFDPDKGSFGALVGAPTPVPSTTVDLTLSPDRRFLYLLDAAGDTLSWHPVDPTSGDVSAVPTDSASTAAGALTLRIDPRGDRLFVPGLAQGELWLHALDGQSGEVSLVQTVRQRGLPVDVALVLGEQPVSMRTRLVLAGHASSSEVRAYQLDAEFGALTDLGGGVDTSGPGADGLALDRRSGRLLSADSGNGVSGFVFNVENGNLSGTGVTASGSTPADVVLDATGRFGFASQPTADALRRIEFVGDNPTDLGQVQLVTARDPGALAITPSGRTLFVAGQDGGAVEALRVGADGTLATVGAVDVDGVPRALEVTPDGHWLLVVAQAPDRVHSYAIDATSGALTHVDSVGAAEGSLDLTITPGGERVYVAAGTAKAIGTIALDPETGDLTALATQVIADAPTALTVDARGETLVVALGSADFFQLLAIDPEDGLLSPLGLAVAGGQEPTSLAPSLELD